jgi:hypothetical protein
MNKNQITIITNSPLQQYLERFNDADLVVRAGEILGSQNFNLSTLEAVQVIACWFHKQA